MKWIINRMMLDLGALVALFMALAPESTYGIDKIEFNQVTATTTSAPTDPCSRVQKAPGATSSLARS